MASHHVGFEQVLAELMQLRGNGEEGGNGSDRSGSNGSDRSGGGGSRDAFNLVLKELVSQRESNITLEQEKLRLAERLQEKEVAATAMSTMQLKMVQMLNNLHHRHQY